MTYSGLSGSGLDEVAGQNRAFHSITPLQADVVAQVLASSGAPCMVEYHDDHDGHFTIVVSPVASDAATFAISGTFHDMALSEMQADEFQLRGRFTSVDAAATALIELQR